MSNASLELGGGKWAAKEGNLLGYASSTSSSKYVPREFSFTRAADIAATRINSSGLIEKYRENLLLQSNQFDTTWTSTSGVSVTDGQSGYDGTNDAWLLARTSTGGERLAQAISQSGVQTYSVYAKANVGDWLYMRCNTSGSPATAWVDLANGVFGSTSNLIDSKIESVGNGWYRCSMAFNSTTVEARLYSVDGNGSVVGTNESIYIQDVQLERGLVATSYLESGATTAKAGVLDNLPRIDYTGGTASLLLEPQRTNSWIHSEYLDYPFSNTGSVTITQNTTETLSPEGLYNAVKLEGVGTWIFRDSIVGTATGTWTISCYVKAVNPSSNNTFRLSLGGNNFSSNLTATSEWQRFEHTFTNGGGSSSGILRDSSTNDADLYIYGFQVEEGSYPTSYIPTYGTIDTRVADICDRGSELAYTGDYTLFMEFELTKDAVYFLNNSALQYRAFFENDDAYFKFGSSNVFFQNMFNWGAALGTNIKMAIYKNGTDAAMFVNGTKYTPSTNTLATGNESLNWRYLNYTTTVDRQEQAYIKQLLEFQSALTDAECIALTT